MTSSLDHVQKHAKTDEGYPFLCDMTTVKLKLNAEDVECRFSVRYVIFNAFNLEVLFISGSFDVAPNLVYRHNT